MSVVVLLLLVLGGPGDKARGLLASDDPRLQAWGAYFVGKNGLKEELPAVRALLDQYKEFKDTNKFVVESALDTLIQLKADVQWQDLKPVSTKFPTHALILLAQHPRLRHDALVELLDGESTDTRWTALCNLLAAQRSPALAVRLLRPLKMYLTITVRDGEENIGLGGGAGGGFRGRGQLVIVLDGWPPRAIYRLTAHSGATLFAPGPRPVYYSRRVIERARRVVGARRPERALNRYRFDYLAELIGTQPKQLAVREKSSALIMWRDSKQYLQEARKARGQIEAAYRSILERLQALKLLTKEEAATLKPKIKISVDDQRRQRPVPLPALN